MPKGILNTPAIKTMSGVRLSKKWLDATFSSFYGFRLAENMRFRPGQRAGTDLRRASGRQNPQSMKSSGFSSVLPRTPQGAFSCPCGAIYLVSPGRIEHKGLQPLINPGVF